MFTNYTDGNDIAKLIVVKDLLKYCLSGTDGTELIHNHILDSHGRFGILKLSEFIRDIEDHEDSISRRGE
jgi:hypothetical protein